jgi:hypothetical protein
MLSSSAALPTVERHALLHRPHFDSAIVAIPTITPFSRLPRR